MLNFIMEDCCRVDYKCGAGIEARERFNGVEIKVGKR